jgi:hypothetical protein
MAALTSKLESMDRNISVLCAAASKVSFADEADDEKSDSDAEKTKSNRNHKALTRKKGRL